MHGFIRRNQKLAPSLFQALPDVSVPFVDFSLHLVAVISCNHEPSSLSSEPGHGHGDPPPKLQSGLSSSSSAHGLGGLERAEAALWAPCLALSPGHPAYEMPGPASELGSVTIINLPACASAGSSSGQRPSSATPQLGDLRENTEPQFPPLKMETTCTIKGHHEPLMNWAKDLTCCLVHSWCIISAPRHLLNDHCVPSLF